MTYHYASSAMGTALAVLKGTGPGTPTTVFNTAMFYADLHAMLELGSSISGCRYFALVDGPVVFDYQSLLRALKANGWTEQRSTLVAHPITLLPSPTLDVITPEKAAIAETWGRRFAGMTVSEAREKSRRNPGWIAAWGIRKPGEQGDEIDLVLAMQELLDDEEDPWLDEPVLDENLVRDPLASVF